MNAETFKRNPLMIVIPAILTMLGGVIAYVVVEATDNETAIAELRAEFRTEMREVKADISQIRAGQAEQNTRTTDIWTAQKDDARLSAEQRAKMMAVIEAVGDQVTRIFEELRED